MPSQRRFTVCCASAALFFLIPASLSVAFAQTDDRIQTVRTYGDDGSGPKVLFPPWAEANGSAPTDPSDNQDFDPGFGGLPTVRNPNFGPSSGVMANLAFGEETYLPAADFGVNNGAGSDALFQRSFRGNRAMAGYGSPGLPAGWVDNFDITVANPRPGSWGVLQLVYPGGATEPLTPEMDPAGRPTGKFTRTGGTPYVVEGRPSATTVGRWDMIIITWKSAHWEFHAGSDSECVLSRLEDLRLDWDPTRRLRSVQSAAGASLLAFTYDARGFLAKVEDSQQRRIEYTVAAVDGLPAGAPPGLATVSSLLPASEKATHVDYEFGYVVRNGHPLLSTVSVPSPTGHGKATATIEYDDAGKVCDHVDANGTKRAFTPAPEGVKVEIVDGSATATGWIQKIDRLGRNTGVIQLIAKASTTAATTPPHGAGAAALKAALPANYRPQPESWRLRDYEFTKIAETNTTSFATGLTQTVRQTPQSMKAGASSPGTSEANAPSPAGDSVNRDESMFYGFADATIDDSGIVSFRAQLLRDPADFFVQRDGLYAGSGGKLTLSLLNRSNNSGKENRFDPFLGILRSKADMSGAYSTLLTAVHSTHLGSEIQLYFAKDGVATSVVSGPNDPLQRLDGIRDFSQSTSGAIAFVGMHGGTRDYGQGNSVYVYKTGRLSELTGEFRHVQNFLNGTPFINDAEVVAFKIRVVDNSGKGEQRIYTCAPPYNRLRLVYTQANALDDRTDLLRLGADGAVYYMTREADQSRIIHRFKDGGTTEIGRMNDVGLRQLSVSVSASGKVTYFASPGFLPTTQVQIPTDTSVYDGDEWAKHIVVQNGDELFGKTVMSVVPVDRDGINARGEVALVVSLSDKRSVVVRADPIRNDRLAATGGLVPPNTTPLTVALAVPQPNAAGIPGTAGASAAQPNRKPSAGIGRGLPSDYRLLAAKALAALTPKSSETQSVHYAFTAIATAANGGANAILGKPSPFSGIDAYCLSPTGAVAFSARLARPTTASAKFIGFSNGAREFRRAVPDSLAGQVDIDSPNPDYAYSFSIENDNKVAFFGRVPAFGPGFLSSDGKTVQSLGGVRTTPALPIDMTMGHPVINPGGAIAFRGNYTYGSPERGLEGFFVWQSGKLVDLTRNLNAGGFNLVGSPLMNDNGLVAFLIDTGRPGGREEHYRIYTYDSSTGVRALATEFTSKNLFEGQAEILQVGSDGAIYYAVFGANETLTTGGPTKYYIARGKRTEPFLPDSQAQGVKTVAISPQGKIAFLGYQMSQQPDLAGQQITGIYTGSDLKKDVVIRSGDKLFGQTVLGVGDTNANDMFRNDSVNDKGQILFNVQLETCRVLVRADPLSPKAQESQERAAPDWATLLPAALTPPTVKIVNGEVPIWKRPATEPELATWPSDPSLASALAANSRTLEGYLFRPPAEYKRGAGRGLLAVGADIWSGAARTDGSRPSLTLSATRLYPDDLDVETLQRHLAKIVAETKARYGKWKQSAAEDGAIDALHFARVYWAGTDAAGHRQHGLIYACAFDTTLIEFSSSDSEPDSKTTLPLAEASFLTFRRIFSPQVFHPQ